MKLLKHSQDLINLFSPIKPSAWSPKTRQTLTWLFRELQEACRIQPSFERKETRGRVTKPSRFADHHFHPKVIRHLNTALKRESIYTFSLHEREVHVFLSSESRMTRQEEDGFVSAVAACLHVVQKYAPRQCASRLSVYLYLTNLTKTLPASPSEILDEWHVNTAFTTSCSPVSEIVVFRREEWFKVFVHETFHAFGLDFSGMARQVADQCVARTFPVKSMGRTYEAYTECWAELWNACFCAYQETRSIGSFLSKVSLYLQAERRHSFFQMVKALNHMGVKYGDLLKGTRGFREHTSVLSYYVLKTILMSDIPAFLDWCRENNRPTASLFAFRQTLRNQTSFCAYLRAHSQSKSMLLGIQEATQWLNHWSQSRKRAAPFLTSNMRMTLCELG